MKKVLFIMSSWWAGGTHSAMNSINNNYDRSKWDLSIYLLSQTGNRDVQYADRIIKSNPFLSAYFCTKKEFKGSEKLLYYIVKAVKKIALFFHADLEPYLFKKASRKIERSYHFDTVVAFIEGSTTRFGTFFNCPNKVAWIHCDYDKYLPAGKSEEAIYSKYTKIVTVSEHTTQVFNNRYPKLADRTLTVYNLFDKQGVLDKAKANIDDSRFDNSAFTLLSVGRIHPVKRFSEIPSISAKLKDKGINFKWFIIGPDFDTDEVSKLKNNIIEYGVQDNVIWLGGKSNPYPYFKNSNLYVCTSLSEACPMVFNEARILGIPVVTADFPSSYEFIDNGNNGVITSFDEIGETIRNIIETPGLYDKLKEGAVRFEYDNQEILTKMDSIF